MAFAYGEWTQPPTNTASRTMRVTELILTASYLGNGASGIENANRGWPGMQDAAEPTTLSAWYKAAYALLFKSGPVTLIQGNVDAYDDLTKAPS